MNRERLTILRDYLLNLPENTKGEMRPQGFDMNTWRSIEGGTMEGWCKTSACALGHACYIPEFQKAGLRIEESHKSWWIFPTPRFNEHMGFAAGEAFFDLEEEEADRLFNPERYSEESDISPVCVASRIEDLLTKE